MKVVDISNQNIYSWSSNNLALSSVAKNGYKLQESMVSVSYSFVTTEDDYKTFVGNLAPGSTFDIDANGKITYDNLGSTLVPSYTLHVEATVTFENLSVVKVIIPVKIKGQK